MIHGNASSQIPVNSRIFATARCPSTAGRAPDQGRLYCSFRIFSVRILYAGVEAGRPFLAAAPDRPDKFPLASASAASIISRSRATSASSSGRIGGSATARSRDSQFSSTTTLVDMADILAGLAGVAVHKVRHDEWDVGGPLPDRRHLDREHVWLVQRALVAAAPPRGSGRRRFGASADWSARPSHTDEPAAPISEENPLARRLHHGSTP